MKNQILNKELTSLKEVISFVSDGLTNESYSIELLASAPLWLRLISRGTYCSYKNIVYVPMQHASLVSSESNSTRTIATAKLLPSIMFIKDNDLNVSALSSLKFLFSLKHQIHYFIYELLFLKGCQHTATDAIFVGFSISRKRMFEKVDPEIVMNLIKADIDQNLKKQ